MSTDRCAHTRYRGFHLVQCPAKNKLTAGADGKSYCGRHHPDVLAAKRAKKTAAFEAELRAEARQRQLDALHVALADAVCSHIADHGAHTLPERIRKIAEAIIAL